MAEEVSWNYSFVPNCRPNLKLGTTEQGIWINFSLKTQEKKPYWEKCSNFFAQILLKLYFEWKIQPIDGHNQDPFFPENQGTFFDFQKRAGKASPLPFPSCAPETMKTLGYYILRNDFFLLNSSLALNYLYVSHISHYHDILV